MELSNRYPRFITPDFRPYDVIEISNITRSIVCRHVKRVEERKYTDFYVAGVYRGIVTGCVVGCNLRCFFCWSPISRDFPERFGEFYSSTKVAEILCNLAKHHRIRKARLSCGEPTICPQHLIEVLEYIEKCRDIELFILETNGIIMGIDESIVKKISNYSKVYVRVSLKAGRPEKFEERTGARREFFELPFRAIKYLLRHGVKFHVAAMTDPRIMSVDERRELINKLASIDPWLAQWLEEEDIDPYRTTLFRLRKAGIKLKW